MRPSLSVVISAILAGGAARAAPPLPVPCAATSCGAGVKGFVTSGSASAVQTGSQLAVTQTTNTATLNWSSFNIGAGGKVTFQQPASTSIALNRIFDSNPSSIFGALSANGQIYLINANGFVFGSGSTVNVGGLLASSLNISDKNFAAGILTPGLTGAPALQPFVDSAGNPVTSQPITVQSGAQLTAADGGRLLLAAPNVTNAGNLSAPDGQVILAAGRSVYLQASADSNLRGLIVEVDGGGTAANQVSGTISAPRGNVTLTGLMVNQDGRVSATTSVAANGSIVLQAADTFPTTYANGSEFTSTHGGTVELGPESVTEILPEYADTTTAVAAQTQLQSSIAITGQQVVMHGADIDAPSGALTVLAAANPSIGVQIGGSPQAQIRIDAGTRIDLSGSDADLPMSANLVTVQLRSNEFADDPTQRNGPLQSTPTKTVSVTIDTRADGGKGTPIADVSSAIAAVGQTIAQRTEAGGTASFLSEGDVILNAGAKINVSGGYTTYEGGTLQTTKLVGANGQLYDIGSANPLMSYTGVVNPTFTETYDKWGVQDVIPTPGLSQYQSTYVQGAAAGKVQFAAPSLSLDGALAGAAVIGPFQRTAPPPGGTLIIGQPIANLTGTNTDYFAPSVTFATTPTPVVVADGSALPPQTLQVPTAYLTSDGFTNTTIYSNTAITLPGGTPLQLLPGSALSLIAPRIDVNSNISSIDGQLNLENVLSTGATGVGTPRPGVALGDGVALNVSGQWTNDDIYANGIGAAPVFQNAGSINLQLTIPASELVLGNDVSLLANGGAWLQSGGALSYGKGGAITLDASPSQSALSLGAGTIVQGFGTGTAGGGSFALLAPRISVSEGTGNAWTTPQRVDDLGATTGPVLDVYASLFSSYGFSSVGLTATGAVESFATSDVLTVASGTAITAQTSTLSLNPNYFGMPTGSALADFSQAMLLPVYERPKSNVALSVLRLGDDTLLGNTNFGVLDVQAGASIVADPGATLALAGEGGVVVGGTLRTLGGAISVTVPSAIIVNPKDSSDITDPGYQPSIGVDLASTSILDVSGTAVMTPTSAGRLTGTLLPGGSVVLGGDRGFVTAESGSLIDIRGSSAVFDVANAGGNGGYTRETVAGAGGSLKVGSPESISLLGNLQAAAGVGNSGRSAAGSLEVDMLRDQSSNTENESSNSPLLPGSTLEIELVDSTATATASPSYANLAVLGAQQIQNSGIDSLTLRAGGTGASGNIVLDAGQLNLGRQLILDAPLITAPGYSTLSAPFVQLGNSTTSGNSALVSTPVAGNGTLNIDAQQMVLSGNFALQGAATATLTSAGDVQLAGTSAPSAAGPTTGSILSSGSLTLNGLRVYPDTYTDFSIATLPGAGSTVSIGSTGFSPGTPLAAGGAVSISADNIVVTGNLLAPFGSISLTANHALTLASGSLVSVSGAGLDIPFGETQLNESEWIYATGNGVINQINGVPTKQITLSAPQVTVQQGATANISGGGDLYAYEWVPGTGGTNDNLNAVCCATSGTTAISSIPNLYAILPSTRGQAGTYDIEESGQSIAGQTIYLSGGAGIAAGYYALLPPRYALASGAVLIQLQPGTVSASGGSLGALADGTPVIGGYLTTGTTGLHAGAGSGLTEFEGVAVYPTGYAQSLSAYDISQASTHFGALATAAGTGAVAEPADAGSLTVSVTPAVLNSLNLLGSVLTSPASGGRGSQINVSAPDLEVTSGTSTAGMGSITVAGAVLQGWNPSSLTLGGVATAVSQSSESIAVAANNVKIDSGVQLTADQIILVAQQSIEVDSGASLLSTSGKSGNALATLPVVNDVHLTDATAAAGALPQAALLSVSDLTLPVVSRTDLNGAVGGTITLATGSTLNSGGALAIDAPGAIALDGTLSGKGASWSLSSGSVGFSGNGTSADTLNVDAGLLASLQQAGAVRIASLGSIDIAGPLSLGVNAGDNAPTLKSFTLVGNSIDDQRGSSVMFGGASLFVGGNFAADPANPPAPATLGSGSLVFVANTLTIGSGVLSVNGFAQTTAQVAGVLQTQPAAYLNVGGNLVLNATELTAAPPALTPSAAGDPVAASQPGATLASSGMLRLGAPTAALAGTVLPTWVGGALTLSASDIEDAGAIVAPSGVVELMSSGALHLASTASIDASGAALHAATATAFAPGGLVSLSSAGNLSLDAGSEITVAGNAGAPAGSIALSAPSGTATLSGALVGAAPSGMTGGSLTIDVGTLSGGLAALVANPGIQGFSEAMGLRVHTGDLDLASGSSITANAITLTADTGAIDIAGMLSAPSAAQRGLIDLSGATGVTLESTGQLHADSSATGRGGEIELNSVASNCSTATCVNTGSITLDVGGVISASGGAQMGELVLRAPALLGSNDVAINSGSFGMGANVSQAGQLIIEPVLVASTTAASVNSDLANDVAAAAAFLSAASPTITARLLNPSPALVSSAVPPLVQAGVELQDANPADALTLQSFDFSNYSTQGQVVSLAVRAAGSITIDGTISDGFASNGVTALTGVPSGALRFVAGADLSSANAGSVLKGSAASLTLTSQSVVRTGTGDIDLTAAGNVVFSSDFNGGASVYTAGLAGTSAATLGSGRQAAAASFPTNGGNVAVTAGGNINGAPFVDPDLDGGNFSVTGWLSRGTTMVTVAGLAQTVGEYGVNLDAFHWNVGALGGGDVSIVAGGQVSNLSAATASSTPDGGATVYGAGGGLRIEAVGDVGSAQIYVGDGKGTIITHGGLTAILPDGNINSKGGTGFVGSSIALGDSQVAVWATQSLQIDAVYNPTAAPASVASNGRVTPSFFTYGTDSSLALSSTDGDVNLELVPDNFVMGALLGPQLLSTSGKAAFLDLPANLSIQALQQNIDLNAESGAILFPANNGQMTLFAGGDIQGNGSLLAMADAALVPTAAAPLVPISTGTLTIGGLAELQDAIHVDDPNPVKITAGGNIDNLHVTLPKAANVSAGLDITNLVYNGQNIAATDTTVITAGRDIDFSTNGGIELGGQGALDVFAGRNVNLGVADGIITTGSLTNANLPSSQGADLTIAVGYGTQGADDASFLKTVVAPSTAYQTQLVNYVETQTGRSGLTFAQAEPLFSTFSTTTQNPFIDSVFFNELLLSGRAANAGMGAGFAEGYAAIDALFPNSRNGTAAAPNPYSGDLNLISSQIYTLSGGNITLLVPGGSIDVGLAYTPVGLAQKSPGQLGIVAEGAGNVDIYSEGDVNVNASRIFTLGGGNILIWSNQGSIDAGNGSKSSLAAPPPVITVASDGSISIDYGGSLSGSGIRTIQTNPLVAAGDVDLDAPVGTVNAGDAGIGAAGNINIAAAHVIGALNINFGGSATGVPSDLSGLSASLSGVSAVANAATTSSTTSIAESSATKETAPLAQTALSWLEVFVTGLGEENCKQDDVECLKRQKFAAP